jgi:cell shape-determining protein MreC
MSYIRFNHVFFSLMLLALLSAFVFSPTATDRVKGRVTNVFSPVSYPSNQIAGWTKDKLFGKRLRDDGSPHNARNTQQLLEENMQLRIALGNLKGQLERMAENKAQRDSIGTANQFCTAFGVSGGDSGARETLMLAGSSFDGLREGDAVLYSGGSSGSGGIAGKLWRVGVGEARVLLVTDKQFSATATFARVVKKADNNHDFVILTPEPRLVYGAGNNEMVMPNVPVKVIEETGVRLDDWIVLKDHDWRDVLAGYRIGYITAITPSKSPGFAEIRIRPDQKLTALREVMVMNKEKG